MTAQAPLRATMPVIGVRPRGVYHSLSLHAPQIARGVTPGQFVSIAVEAPGTLLRRPFSVADAGGETVEVVFAAVGPGTRWLAARAPGDRLDVVGPLGTNFTPPAHAGGCVLVGGGYGSAPLAFLARRLRSRGLAAHLLVGAATSARLLAFEGATVVTEDGTAGRRGLVTDVLDDALEQTGAAAVYACGPMPMLAAVSVAAGRRGLPCQVAVEESMACGVGVCWTCVVPVRAPAGVANLRACVEGPVLDGAAVVW